MDKKNERLEKVSKIRDKVGENMRKKRKKRKKKGKIRK
jgi:hypothetical protein